MRGKRFKPVGAPRAVAIHAPGAGQRGLVWRDITSELTEDSTLAERFETTADGSKREREGRDEGRKRY